MIPYEDLVAALASWRARQGLPVAGGVPLPGSGPTDAPISGSGGYPGSGPTGYPGSGPTGYPGSGPTVSPGSGPVANPGSGPARATPPNAPPKPSHGMYQPPPLASPDTADDSLDVDDEALLEEAHYENEGDDFEMKFAPVEKDDESTTLGQAPERDSFGGETQPDPKSRKP